MALSLHILTILTLFALPCHAQRISVSANEVRGTFRQYFRNTDRILYSEVRIIPLGKNKLYVEFDFLRPKLGDPHFGWTHGLAWIQGDSATFELTEYGDSTCVIPIKFNKPGELIIADQYGRWDDCGFGYGVVGDGRYKKIDGGTPELHWYSAYASAKRSLKR